MIIKLRGRRWLETFGCAKNMCLLLSLMVASCAMSVPAAKPSGSDSWDFWFAEYELISGKPHPSYDVLTVFQNRFVISPRADDINTRLRSDLGNSFHVIKKDGEYFVDSLPIFIPLRDGSEIVGTEFDCQSRSVGSEYEISCLTKSGKTELKSLYSPTEGVKWLDYFCGYPLQVCRYRFSHGTKLFRPGMIQILEGDGLVTEAN